MSYSHHRAKQSGNIGADQSLVEILWVYHYCASDITCFSCSLNVLHFVNHLLLLLVLINKEQFILALNGFCVAGHTAWPLVPHYWPKLSANQHQCNILHVHDCIYFSFSIKIWSLKSAVESFFFFSLNIIHVSNLDLNTQNTWSWHDNSDCH